MADRNKYYDGTNVSRHLPTGERAWSQVVYESGKPVLDAELNLNQDALQEISRVVSNRTVPSGWLKGQTRRNAFNDFSFPEPGDPGFQVNSFLMEKRTAMVAGFPVVVEYANIDSDGSNRIVLDSPPVFGGPAPDVKRTDFVFLEVWQALVSDSPNASGTITVDTNPGSGGDDFDIAGNTLTGVAGPPGVDEYQVGGTAEATAANIAAAINNSPPNSFANVTASAVGPVVTVRAVVSGTAGNALTFSQTAGAGGGSYTLTGAGFLSGGVDESGKPGQDLIYRHGNTDSSAAVALADDLADPIIGVGTARRVQVQYRIRVTGQSEAVNFKSEPDGFSNSNVLAQGATGAPVAGYPFVPADATTVSSNTDATAYGDEDSGLWVAGDGSSTAASDLGSVDGFVYAIPIAFVFRRNDSSAGNGWDPDTNTNGGLPSTHGGFVSPTVGSVAAGESDRPDAKFVDVIYADDVLDLRKHVVTSGQDLQAELLFQMHSLLDNDFATWAVDTSDKQDLGSGSGDVSWQYLVCNEFGRTAAAGGNPGAGSGDTTRGVTVRNFDHVCRRFGDQPVVERIVLALSPTDAFGANPGKYVAQANGGYTGWAEDDEIHIDLGALNASTMGDFALPGDLASGAVLSFAPPGTTITNVLIMEHDDGNYGAAVDRTVVPKLVTGIGSSHVVVTLDRNDTPVNGGAPGPTNRVVGDSVSDDGSTRRIFVEVEVTYPLGSGPTDTPLVQLQPDTNPYPSGPLLENNTTQRPQDWEELPAARIRDGYREVAMEYVANAPGSGVGSNTPISDNFVSTDDSSIRFLRRIFGSGTKLVNVTDAVTATPQTVDTLTTEYGSSTRTVNLSTALSGAGQTQVDVTYFAQDAIPNAGGAGGGYQVSVYFRSPSPQTAGTKAAPLDTLPSTLTIEPLVMGTNVWTGTVGKGSVDLPYPFLAPLDQIPVNDGGSSSFPGEWYFSGTAKISIDDFDAETGLLALHPNVPLVGSESFTFEDKAVDAEFRAHYQASDPATYRPTVFAQGLSGVARHKVFFPFLARATEDTALWRKNEVLLVVLSRFAELDEENTIRFVTPASSNRTAAAIYRTRNLLLIAGD